MSAFVGKQLDDSNVLHFTSGENEVSEMNRGPLSTSFFHSSRPYLVIDKVINCLPDYANQTYTTIGLLDEGDDYWTLPYTPSEAFTLTSERAVIIIAKLNLKTETGDFTGWFINSCAVGPRRIYSNTSPLTYGNFYIKVEDNGVVQAHLIDAVETTAPLNGSPGTYPSAPLEIDILIMKNNLNNFSNPELSGDLEISRTNGIRVGTTQFFEDHFMFFSDTQLTGIDHYKEYAIVDPESAVNEFSVPIPYHKPTAKEYLYISNKLTPPYEIKLESKTVTLNGQKMIAPEIVPVQKSQLLEVLAVDTSPIDFTTTSPTYLPEFGGMGSGSHTAVDQWYGDSDAVGIHLKDMNVTDTSAIFFNLKFTHHGNKSPFVISGYLRFNEGHGQYADIGDVNGGGAMHAVAFGALTGAGGTTTGNLIGKTGGVLVIDYVKTTTLIADPTDHSTCFLNGGLQNSKNPTRIEGWIIITNTIGALLSPSLEVGATKFMTVANTNLNTRDEVEFTYTGSIGSAITIKNAGGAPDSGIEVFVNGHRQYYIITNTILEITLYLSKDDVVLFSVGREYDEGVYFPSRIECFSDKTATEAYSYFTVNSGTWDAIVTSP